MIALPIMYNYDTGKLYGPLIRFRFRFYTVSGCIVSFYFFIFVFRPTAFSALQLT